MSINSIFDARKTAQSLNGKNMSFSPSLKEENVVVFLPYIILPSETESPFITARKSKSEAHRSTNQSPDIRGKQVAFRENHHFTQCFSSSSLYQMSLWDVWRSVPAAVGARALLLRGHRLLLVPLLPPASLQPPLRPHSFMKLRLLWAPSRGSARTDPSSPCTTRAQPMEPSAAPHQGARRHRWREERMWVEPKQLEHNNKDTKHIYSS